MLDFLKKYVEELLQDNDIDIHNPNYKNSEDYARIKDSWFIVFEYFSMSLDEFIERFLLTEQEIWDIYDSKYDMGSKYIFDDDECEDLAVAEEIIREDEDKNENNIEAETHDFVKKFFRSGGIIERLKTYLCFDLDAFDKKDKRYKRERCKILYFFYMLEHKYFPKTNVLMLLSKPSMENIDNSSIGMQTYNGMIIKLIKDSLGKELSLSKKEEIRKAIDNIVPRWDNILDNARILLDFFDENGCKYDFKRTIRSLKLVPKDIYHAPKYSHSPIETLYLKIVQHEYLGNIFDISKTIFSKDYGHDVPPELIEEMKELYYSPIDISNVEQYIDENALRISKYVYLGAEVSRDDIRRIRTFKKKIPKLIDFCKRARPSLEMKDISNELQIISFLQAITLDDQSEPFDYTYPGYQNHGKHIPRVQAALKNDKHIPDALQCYWVRKSMDHWYANIGRYDALIKLREFERVCNSVLEEILSKPNLDEMQQTHKLYLDEIGDELITTTEQIQAVQQLVKYLHKKGFKYVDNYYLIRYVFLYPPEIDCIFANLTMLISDTIKSHDPTLQVMLEAYSANGDDKLVFEFELAFDYDINECIMQKLDMISVQ